MVICSAPSGGILFLTGICQMCQFPGMHPWFVPPTCEDHPVAEPHPPHIGCAVVVSCGNRWAWALGEPSRPLSAHHWPRLLPSRDPVNASCAKPLAKCLYSGAWASASHLWEPIWFPKDRSLFSSAPTVYSPLPFTTMDWICLFSCSSLPLWTFWRPGTCWVVCWMN